VDALIAEEMHNAHAYGGRSVFGWEPAAELAQQSRRRQSD
jgi:hypothetical protein